MHTPDAIISSENIKSRVEELAISISKNSEQHLVIIGLLKGSFIFTADLSRALSKYKTQCQVDFMRVSSYGKGKKSSGHLKIIHDIELDIQDKHVLLVDDIIDTGTTLHHTKNLLIQRGAKKVITCTLLDKPSGRKNEFEADYTGFKVGNNFVVGYGIDYAESYRELPFIGTVG